MDSDIKIKLRKVAAVALCSTAPKGEREAAAARYFDLLLSANITIETLPEIRTEEPEQVINPYFQNNHVKSPWDGVEVVGRKNYDERGNNGAYGYDGDLEYWRNFLSGDIRHVDKNLLIRLLGLVPKRDPLYIKIHNELTMRNIDPNRTQPWDKF
jgi:hypothetical protein